MEKKVYDFVLPLGEVCFTATLLQKMNLRIMSCPFDWVYGSDFIKRFNLFLNDFENFLNRDELIYKYRTYFKKDAYFNCRTKLIFNHDFKAGVPLDKMYNKVKAKYDRRILRTLNKIKSSKNVLLLFVERNNTQNEFCGNDKLIELYNIAKKKYPKTNFDLLYIKHNQDLKPLEVIYDEITSNVTVAQCYNIPYDEKSPDWESNYQNSAKVLEFVKIRHSLFNLLYELFILVFQRN